MDPGVPTMFPKKFLFWARCEKDIATDSAIFDKKFSLSPNFYTLYIERVKKCKNDIFSLARESQFSWELWELGNNSL